MPKKEIKNWRKHMVQLFKDGLGRPIPVALLDDYPEIEQAMAAGQPAPETAAVVVAKIIRYAVDRHKPNTWAIQMIYDYVVGKPQQTPADADAGRHFDEKVNDVTTEHLNALAEQFQASGGGFVAKPQAENGADRSMASALMEMPEDGIGGSEGSGSEPEMA